MVDQVNVSSTEFAAFQADINERIDNVLLQIDTLDKKIESVLDTQEVVEFPDEQAQIREKVLTAFQDEIANLNNTIQTLQAQVATLQGFHTP